MLDFSDFSDFSNLAGVIDPCTTSLGCVKGIDVFQNDSLENTGQSVAMMVQYGANLFAMVCASLATFYIVWSGWNMLNAQGDTAKFKKAFDAVFQGAFGLFVIACAWGFVSGVVTIVTQTTIGK